MIYKHKCCLLVEAKANILSSIGLGFASANSATRDSYHVRAPDSDFGELGAPNFKRTTESRHGDERCKLQGRVGQVDRPCELPKLPQPQY